MRDEKITYIEHNTSICQTKGCVIVGQLEIVTLLENGEGVLERTEATPVLLSNEQQNVREEH